MEEIVEFIKKLETNGYAYRSNGSVYFNVNVKILIGYLLLFFRNTMMVPSIYIPN